MVDLDFPPVDLVARVKSFKAINRRGRATRAMQGPEPYLKTRQVAQALGVSVSTVKRWVDAGELRANRTVGKHRLIPRSEAERFAQAHGLKFDLRAAAVGDGRLTAEADPELEGLPEGPATHEINAELVESFVTTLRRGRVLDAHDIVVATFRTAGAVRLADELVRPAMERIGHDWEEHGLDVFQEHRATRAIKQALMELNQRLQMAARHRPPGPLALGAAPEHDPYTLPGLLCELALREQGWDVTNLGVNLPLASLAKATRAHRPRLVWLSVTYLVDPAAFLREYASFHEIASATGAAVALGGQALTPDLRARLVAASFGDRMAHLAEFARRMRPDVVATQDRTSPDHL
jgi:excisionase family DNA binding protein